MIAEAAARAQEIRRQIHRRPEVMFEEHETSALVQAELKALGIEFVAGLARGTGVLGFLPATGKAEATVALRADMDALPILEETGVEHASERPGTMHACGHDGHTAILLGTARALAAMPERRNNTLFLFQPAEEGGAGGDLMCKDGALDGTHFPKADLIYGLHGWPARKQGALSTRIGAAMASTDQFYVTLRGSGGHAAAPDLSVDPIVCLGACIQAVQSIISRNAAPSDQAVVTIGTVNAGTATNIIPDTAEFTGTVRTVDEGIRAVIKERFHTLVKGIATAHGCEPTIRWEPGYPVTFNDEWATRRALALAAEEFGEGRVSLEEHPKMGAEDFSFYGAHAPACFVFVGLQREGETDPPGLHTPRFDFNDAVIPDCIRLFMKLSQSPVERA